MKSLGGLIANVKLSLTLRKRKAIRKVESERVRQGKLAAQRERWANDPLRAVFYEPR